MTNAVNIAQSGSNNQTMRNRIINGGMMISQRGTSFAGLTNGSSQFTIDRWAWNESGAATAVQTVSQDSSAPVGFVNSLKVLTTTAQASLASSNSYRVGQTIEGYNISDLGWGTANAQPVTLGFWVRSSLTGSFGGNIFNGASNRFYVFSYTINSADTWEYKTVTIAGDTSGTWATDNSLGIGIQFSMGAGSDYLTTAGSWGSSRADAPTGQVNVAGTLNATFYITGVQLEKGSTATSFDYRPYGTEELLCKRYYTKFSSFGSQYAGIGCGVSESSTNASMIVKYPVTMRASPTAGQSTTGLYDGSAVRAITSLSTNYQGNDCLNINVVASGGGLTTGRGTTFIINNSSTGYFELNAEL